MVSSAYSPEHLNELVRAMQSDVKKERGKAKVKRWWIEVNNISTRLCVTFEVPNKVDLSPSAIPSITTTTMVL